jgi:hypothetical protein
MNAAERTTERVSTLLTPADKKKFREMAQSDKRRPSAMLRKLVLDAIAAWERRRLEQTDLGQS